MPDETMSATSATNQAQRARSSDSASGASSASGRTAAKKRMSTTLSVIVPAYNEQYLIGESLSRLLVLGESPILDHVKVIVVNDGSKDDTAEAIEQFQISMESRQA